MTPAIKNILIGLVIGLAVVGLVLVFSGDLRGLGALLAVGGAGAVAGAQKQRKQTVKGRVAGHEAERRNAGQIAEDAERKAREAGARADAERARRDAEAKAGENLPDDEVARRFNRRHGLRDPDDPAGT